MGEVKQAQIMMLKKTALRHPISLSWFISMCWEFFN